MRSVLILFIFLHLSWTGQASSLSDTVSVKNTDSPHVRVDTATIAARSFEESRLNDYKKDSAFDYREEAIPLNWWQQFKQWFYQKLSRLFANRHSAVAFKWLFILIGVSALLFLIYKLSGMDLVGIFGKKSSSTPELSLEDTENIHFIHFEKEIKEAIDGGHYRQAVRLLYLQSLKDLTDKQHIHWQPGKTNNIYLRELHEKSFKKDFANLTGQFEYIWYGGFPIYEADFGPLQQQFISFRQQIN